MGVSWGKTLAIESERLSIDILGKAGIHSVGIDRASGTIRIYVKPGESVELKELIVEIERTAAPLAVRIIISDRAYLLSGKD